MGAGAATGEQAIIGQSIIQDLRRDKGGHAVVRARHGVARQNAI